jgi:hypothetical protein
LHTGLPSVIIASSGLCAKSGQVHNFNSARDIACDHPQRRNTTAALERGGDGNSATLEKSRP